MMWLKFFVASVHVLLILIVAGCGLSSPNPRPPGDKSPGVKVSVAFGGPVKSGGQSWSLNGSYEGELKEDQSLWLLAERDGLYRAVRPSIEIDRKEQSWRHLQIKLPSGSWKLHICQASKAGSDALGNASSGKLARLPTGVKSLKTVRFESTLTPEADQLTGKDQPSDTPPSSPGRPQWDPNAAPTKELSPISPSDLIMIQFDVPVDDVREKHDFGIFRHEKEPREKQWIEEFDGIVALANGAMARALRLHYEVPVSGAYNGWWLKLGDSDWSAFAEGDLVLRMRLGNPCTTAFKLELKTNPGEVRHVAIVRLNQDHLSAMQAAGFCDVAIPLEQIVEGADISMMAEIVLVFENRRVDEKKGDLLLHSIRLSPSKEAVQP